MKKIILTVAASLAVAGSALCAPAPLAAGAEEQMKQADVWIVAGQSNAAGWSNLTRKGIEGSHYTSYHYEEELNEIDPRNGSGYNNVLYYGSGLDQRADRELPKMSLTSVAMKTPLQAGTSGHIGPELGMANALSSRYTPDSPAVIIKYAVGGTYLGDFKGDGQQTKDYGNWASPSMTAQAPAGTNFHKNNGLLYTRLLQTVTNGFAALKAQRYAPSVKGYIWMQGEADAGTSSLANAYQKNLELFIGDLRKDVAEIAKDDSAKTRPFVIGKINSTGLYGNFVSVVRAAEDAVCEKLPNVFTVDTNKYDIVKDGVVVGSDQWHFNAADMYDLGKRFAACALENVAKYTYSVTAGAGGSVAKRTYLSDGEAVTVGYTAERGKKLSAVKLNGEDVTQSCLQNGKISFTPNAQTAAFNTVELLFADAAAYRITVNLGAGGKINRSISGSRVYEGDEIVIETLPADGYETESVIFNGAAVSPREDGKYTVVVGAADCTLSVTFKKTEQANDPMPEESGLSGGAIAGIVIGSVAGAGAIAAGGALLAIKAKKRK